MLLSTKEKVEECKRKECLDYRQERQERHSRKWCQPEDDRPKCLGCSERKEEKVSAIVSPYPSSPP